MRRVALATYESAPDLAPDDQALVPALTRVGIRAEPAVWSDRSLGWEFAGSIPRYARSATGALDANAIYYRLLDTQ